MANNHIYGFRFKRSISGASTPQILTFPITSGYAPVTIVGAGTSVNLNIGDPVRFSEAGAIELVQAGQDNAAANTDADDYAFGVIAGFPRVIVGGFARPGSFYTSGTTYTGGIGSDNAPLVSVIPVEGNIFELDSSAVVGAATKNACMALIGNTCRMTYSVLTSGTGQPKANPLALVSDVAVGGADQFQLLLVGLGKAGDAIDFTATNVPFQVMWSARSPGQAMNPAIFGANVQ